MYNILCAHRTLDRIHCIQVTVLAWQSVRNLEYTGMNCYIAKLLIISRHHSVSLV